MKEILLQIGLPIFTALLAYIGVRYQSKNDLKKQIELNNTEIQKVKELCNNEIEKIQVQMDKQSQLYEKNAQTDIMKEFMSDILKDPSKGSKNLKGLLELASTLQGYKNQ